jgi:hypothetical protein
VRTPSSVIAVIVVSSSSPPRARADLREERSVATEGTQSLCT